MTAIASIITALHLAALSQIETGDNDKAIGNAGEVSRWQCCPEFYTGKHPSDPAEARPIVLKLWESRCEKFSTSNHRSPSLVEIYLLWHRPARVLNPRPRERERAQRFANLFESLTRGK